MDKPKTQVVKSKSSNSAITSKSEPKQQNKKSRSSAEFPSPVERRRGVQKRGVYVEKKPSQISINDRDLSPSIPPPKPIPRPGRKRFLNSVLNILSQSTTGTQFPEKDDLDKKRLEKCKVKLKKKKEGAIQEDSVSSDFTPIPKKKTQEKEKTHRDRIYKSRLLSDATSDLEQLIVLQSTKEITHTPSNNSVKSHTGKDSSTFKWTDSSGPITKNLSDKLKEKKIKFHDQDPSTIISDVPKKDEKKLYNFFVDLLETTFNVYNVETEVTGPPPSSLNSSKVAFEMDENVAKKLDIQKVNDPSTTSDDGKITKTSSRQFYFIRPDDNELWDDKHLLEHFHPSKAIHRQAKTMSPIRSNYKKRKLMSESLEHRKEKSRRVPTSSSFTPFSMRVMLKKERKRTFMKSLKKQLKMDGEGLLEPQNFYQALQVIARNKRRCQKSIHFNTKTLEKPNDTEHVCKFNRRRLLSASTKSSSKKSSNSQGSECMRSIRSFNTRYSDFSASSKRKNTITITETETGYEPSGSSQMSLEVFGYDYETKSKVNEAFSRTSLLSEKDYMNEVLLNYSVSSVLGIPSNVDNKIGIR